MDSNYRFTKRIYLPAPEPKDEREVLIRDIETEIDVLELCDGTEMIDPEDIGNLFKRAAAELKGGNK